MTYVLTISSILVLLWRQLFWSPYFALPQEVYYSFLSLIAFFLLARGGSLNWRGILFLFLATISLLVNNVDPIFHSKERLISFSILLLVVGGVIDGKYSYVYRAQLFKYLTYSIVALSSLSFFVYFTKAPLFFHHNGLFKGLFNHSMVLGAFSGISAVYCLQLLLGSNCTRNRLIWMSFLVASTISCLLAGSRIALFSAIICSVALFILKFRSSIQKMIIAIASVSFILLSTSPIWYEYTENVRIKMERSEAKGSAFNSRRALWKDRLTEFGEHPIFGSGFASMDKTLVSVQTSNTDTGVIEPGSSWLFLLSSMGLTGLISFLTLLFPCKKIIARAMTFRGENTTLLFILLFFSVHMFAEGYIVASGNLLCVYLWLVIGMLQPRPQMYAASLKSE